MFLFSYSFTFCWKFFRNLLAECQQIFIISSSTKITTRRRSSISVEMFVVSFSVKDQLTAADIVNHMSVDGLQEVLKKYGEERHAKLIAHAIVDSRYAFGPITTTTQLANIVSTACDGLHSYSV